MKDFKEIKVSGCKIQKYPPSPQKQCLLKRLLLTLADKLTLDEFQALKLLLFNIVSRGTGGMLLNLCEILARCTKTLARIVASVENLSIL